MNKTDKNNLRIKCVERKRFLSFAQKDGRTQTKVYSEMLSFIASQYSDDFPDDIPAPGKHEICISNVDKKDIRKLQKIATYYCVNLSAFLKVKMGDIMLKKKAV